jgi:hypothetical protein
MFEFVHRRRPSFSPLEQTHAMDGGNGNCDGRAVMAANANLLRTALAVPHAAAAAPAAAAAGAPVLVTSESIIQSVQLLQHNNNQKLLAKDTHIANMKLLADGVKAELTKVQGDLAGLFAEHETAKATLDTMVMFCFACAACVCCLSYVC